MSSSSRQRRATGRIERLDSYNLMSLTPDGPVYYARGLGEKAYLTRPLDPLMRVVELRVISRHARVYILLEKGRPQHDGTP